MCFYLIQVIPGGVIRVYCVQYIEKKNPCSFFTTSTSTPRIHKLSNSSPSTNELKELEIMKFKITAYTACKISQGQNGPP